jgi:signal transduction histidine kinase/CheY-like chemotaxis protein
MCAATIPTFTSTDGHLNTATTYMKTDKESFVIYDMSKVDAYKDRPYVTGWPHMRYYAEVPISTPNGLCIGSICTVDDKPRESLSPKDMATLQDIAMTIMDHLDLLSSRVQRKRAEHMIRGFGLFADSGESKLMRDARRTEIRNGENKTPIIKDPSVSHETLPGAIKGQHQILNNGNYISRSPSPPPFRIISAVKDSAADNETHSQTGCTSSGASSKAADPSMSLKSHETTTKTSILSDKTPSELATRIKKAADIMREALDLEGITIFDRRRGKAASDLPNLARILTSSSPASGSNSPIQVSEVVLSLAIKRFPEGGVLRFGPQGKYESYAEFEAPEVGLQENPTKIVSQDDTFLLAEEAELLNADLGARSMILFPLWSTSTDKLFAYAIGFTSVSSRVFQREDFAYLSSFSNVVAAELFRLDVIAADRAKADFISSISHELRSPLHGILASTDLLRDYITSKVSTEIFNTIEACGSTLADTLNNLLTFAKINNFTATRNQEVNLGQPAGERPEARTWSEPILYDSNAITDLGNLVEEVAKSSIAGHQMRTDLEVQTSQQTHRPSIDPTSTPPLTVICEIQTSSDWRFPIQAGTWKRIVMNLLGNSLKYTSLGFVRIKLNLREEETLATGEVVHPATLVVEDTGRGISEAFLETSLYKPFRQENSLQPGTGLGLSIVKQLVESIGGQINITSQIGSGTVVTVEVNLARESSFLSHSQLEAVNLYLPRRILGQRVGLFGFDCPLPSNVSSTVDSTKLAKRSVALQAALKFALKEFGLQTVVVNSLSSENVDVLMMLEESYSGLDREVLQTRKFPLILISSAVGLDYRNGKVEDGLLVFLSQPFGPQQLARVLELCSNPSGDVSVPTSEDHIGDMLPVRSAKDNTADLLEATTIILSIQPSPTNLAVVEKPLEVERRARALLVEDNPVNLKVGALSSKPTVVTNITQLLVMFMKKLKCSYETANDGQEAVDIYRAAHGAFDVVLTDIQMPEKDGMEAAAEIRQHEQGFSLKRTPIIAITGLGSQETRNQAVDSGIDLLLTKPMSFQTLRKVIDTWVPLASSGQ